MNWWMKGQGGRQWANDVDKNLNFLQENCKQEIFSRGRRGGGFEKKVSNWTQFHPNFESKYNWIIRKFVSSEKYISVVLFVEKELDISLKWRMICIWSLEQFRKLKYLEKVFTSIHLLKYFKELVNESMLRIFAKL